MTRIFSGHARGTVKKTKVVGALVLVGALSACALSPDPFTQAEFEEKAAADRLAMVANQDALTGPLTLDEAITRVLKYNLDSRAKMMEEALALGQLNLDTFDLLPKAPVNGGFDYRSQHDSSKSYDEDTGTTGGYSYSDELQNWTGDLGLTWNVLDFGVSYFTAKQNADRALIAQERRRRAVQDLIRETRSAYWRAVAADVMRAKVQDTVIQAEAALANAERIEAERLAAPAEALRTQKTLLESLRQLEAVERELLSAKAELAALINLPPGQDFAIATYAPMDVPTMDLAIERMEELALANNPDLREQDYQSRIAIQETRKEIVRLLPGVNLSFSGQYDGNSYLANNAWTAAGVQISWNLMEIIAAPFRIDHALTGEDVAEAKRLALRMAVLAKVHVATNAFSGAVRQFERADRLWTIEDRLTTLTARQGQGGMAGTTERVVQETSSILAELRRYRAYAEMQKAFGDVQATLGMDPTPDTIGAGGGESLSAVVNQPTSTDADQVGDRIAEGEPRV
jgi:outer membrane protein TolC